MGGGGEGGCVSEGLKFVAKMQKHQGGSGQRGCVRRIEVIVKMGKKSRPGGGGG